MEWRKVERQWRSFFCGVVGLGTASLLVLSLGLSHPALSAKKTGLEKRVSQLNACASLDDCKAVKAIIATKGGFWPGIKGGLASTDEMTRFWVLGILSKAPVKEAMEDIATMLADPKVRVRAAAAYALGSLKGAKVTLHLERALEDKDLNVRFAAVVAMGRVGDPVSLKALLRACRDKDEDVRAYALMGLGDLGLVAALPRMHERLDEDVHPKVRGFAAMALARIGHRSSVEPLERRLADEKDPKALSAAIAALGATAGPASVAKIKKHATHVDETVRRYVADALQSIAKRQVKQPLKP